MNTITNTVFKAVVILATFVVLAFAITSTVRAADLTDYITPDYVTTYSSFDNDYITPDYVTTYVPFDDYITPDYVTTYSPMDSWSPSSFGGGSSFFGGGGFSTPSNFRSATNNLVTNNGNAYTYAPQNTNVCTGGNVCNDNSVFNAPTTVTVTGSGNTPVYQPPVYTPVYPPVYQQPVYPQPPVYYPPAPTYRAPYVSLSAVPYTGLELGPMGTVLYWSFLVLWCLVAAYLIAVKKVQNKIVSAVNGYLFPAATTHAKHTARVYNAPKAEVKQAPAESGIDPFIASQINRLR